MNDDAVAGLAREVDGVRRLVQPLAVRVEDLAQLVARLSSTVASRGQSVPPRSWVSAPVDEEEVHRLLDDVGDWLGRVYLRYADARQTFPDCWCWHPEVVEELAWLMQAWDAAYWADGASVVLAGDWHERLRPGVVRRIRQYAGTCSRDNHRTRPGWPSIDGSAAKVPSLDDLTAISEWWAHRRNGVAPEPEPTAAAIRQALDGQA
ncbi:hypothetical protein LWC33_15395 [Pseudonocardia sp. RS11V-5]|uniref:hypothetical protein n=1 Tax=Pseudonocardia terrae TaxID=2905831 RepID=UPI001E440D28|nr:hypothetical protein [Pseudonocardia terrae]MCE3552836.1 hypothetical protein [Pseudonocardia terrae]